MAVLEHTTKRGLSWLHRATSVGAPLGFQGVAFVPESASGLLST